ncbi:MAG: fumarylacetoacetate hydrolase family protein [Bradymonadaceae bacterium]|nr:fumarylacetoacetate hydrolase family protein [Lujinxingiaceae bacterium]
MHTPSQRVCYALKQDGLYLEVTTAFEAISTTLAAGEQLALGTRLGSDHEVRLLAPTTPSKVICVGLNYRRHAEEMGKTVPEEPLIFLKPSTAVIGPEEPILLPPQASETHHEGELGIVIGKRAAGLSEQEALSVVLGYTCANDVTARDIQRREQRYTRSKGFDSFCPLGPAIALAPSFVPGEHRLICRVNATVRQSSTLNDFIFSIPQVIAFISQVMTLLPGDVILTGTPAGVGAIVEGDMVEVEIDGIGVLRNLVRSK